MQPVLLWESNEYYTTCVCICSLRYQVCNAHEPYYHLACPALHNFSTLSHKTQNFRKQKLSNTKCVFRTSLQISSETFFILRRNERDMIINVYWCSCKVPLFLSDHSTTNFLDKFSKNSQILNLMRIRPLRARLLHADGQT